MRSTRLVPAPSSTSFLRRVKLIVVMGKPVPAAGATKLMLPVQNATLRREGGHPILHPAVHGCDEKLTYLC